MEEKPDELQFKVSNQLPTHITQSPGWGEFKTKMGTPAVRCDGVQLTLHKIPLIPYHIGYCPKVDPEKINWEGIKTAGKENRCVAIRFDCPNVIKRVVSEEMEKAFQKHCVKSPRNTFAKHTIFLDLTPDEETLLAQMKPKTRYNIRYAMRNKITVEEQTNKEGLKIFLALQRETAKRQKFLIHPDNYFRTLFETLKTRKMVHILVAKHNAQNLAAYVLLNYQGVLYYPYGGSSIEKRNLFPSNLLMWEALRLGKELGCTLMDMWGATDDKNDPWWGFTRFKLGYGGKLVEFIGSYDLVTNRPIYITFNLAYGGFWKIVNLLRNL